MFNSHRNITNGKRSKWNCKLRDHSTECTQGEQIFWLCQILPNSVIECVCTGTVLVWSQCHLATHGSHFEKHYTILPPYTCFPWKIPPHHIRKPSSGVSIQSHLHFSVLRPRPEVWYRPLLDGSPRSLTSPGIRNPSVPSVISAPLFKSRQTRVRKDALKIGDLQWSFE